jgi:hypothetical protein
VDLNLMVPEYAEDGSVRRVPKTIKARIPKGRPMASACGCAGRAGRA